MDCGLLQTDGFVGPAVRYLAGKRKTLGLNLTFPDLVMLVICLVGLLLCMLYRCVCLLVFLRKGEGVENCLVGCLNRRYISKVSDQNGISVLYISC